MVTAAVAVVIVMAAATVNAIMGGIAAAQCTVVDAVVRYECIAAVAIAIAITVIAVAL